jgi:hypothetical protein
MIVIMMRTLRKDPQATAMVTLLLEAMRACSTAHMAQGSTAQDTICIEPVRYTKGLKHWHWQEGRVCCQDARNGERVCRQANTTACVLAAASGHKYASFHCTVLLSSHQMAGGRFRACPAAGIACWQDSKAAVERPLQLQPLRQHSRSSNTVHWH